MQPARPTPADGHQRGGARGRQPSRLVTLDAPDRLLDIVLFVKITIVVRLLVFFHCCPWLAQALELARLGGVRGAERATELVLLVQRLRRNSGSGGGRANRLRQVLDLERPAIRPQGPRRLGPQLDRRGLGRAAAGPRGRPPAAGPAGRRGTPPRPPSLSGRGGWPRPASGRSLRAGLRRAPGGAKGVPLKAVQELMGHATIEMTMRYAHLSPDVRRLREPPGPGARSASLVARRSGGSGCG